LVFQEHGTQVAVVTEDDRVHLKPITVVKLMDNAVEVAGGGISTSDRVVNNPSAALLEGEKVRVVTPAPGYDLMSGDSPESKETPASTEDQGSKEIHGSTEAPAPKEHSIK
jgi:hypothetical protein